MRNVESPQSPWILALHSRDPIPCPPTLSAPHGALKLTAQQLHKDPRGERNPQAPSIQQFGGTDGKPAGTEQRDGVEAGGPPQLRLHPSPYRVPAPESRCQLSPVPLSASFAPGRLSQPRPHPGGRLSFSEELCSKRTRSSLSHVRQRTKPLPGGRKGKRAQANHYRMSQGATNATMLGSGPSPFICATRM